MVYEDSFAPRGYWSKYSTFQCLQQPDFLRRKRSISTNSPSQVSPQPAPQVNPQLKIISVTGLEPNVTTILTNCAPNYTNPLLKTIKLLWTLVERASLPVYVY
jgi:hypothetical protein